MAASIERTSCICLWFKVNVGTNLSFYAESHPYGFSRDRDTLSGLVTGLGDFGLFGLKSKWEGMKVQGEFEARELHSDAGDAFSGASRTDRFLHLLLGE